MVSGDQFVSSHEKKDWLVETFGGYCTEMEGAAIASMDYPAFEKKAIANSVTLILEMAVKL